MSVTRRSLLVAAGVGAIVLGGCGGERTPVRASKNVKGELRTDAEPLTSRFPALGTPISVRWFSGTVGDAGFGPTTYWIDAVVEVTEQVVGQLMALDQATAATPNVVDQLVPELPEGEFVTSPELNAAFHTDRWRVQAYLQPDTATVVLSALGE